MNIILFDRIDEDPFLILLCVVLNHRKKLAIHQILPHGQFKQNLLDHYYDSFICIPELEKFKRKKCLNTDFAIIYSYGDNRINYHSIGNQKKVLMLYDNPIID